MNWLYPIVPIACFPIAHWYVFLGDWLWWGYGINPATTPNIVKGAISKWVEFFFISSSFNAINTSFSSFTSKYSILPSFTKELNVIFPSSNNFKSSFVTKIFSFSVE